MIASTTSAPDAIAVIFFATVLLLVIVSIVSLVAWLLRWVRWLILHKLLGRPVPVKPQRLTLRFHADTPWDPHADDDAQPFWDHFERFSAYLESRLHREGLGDLLDADWGERNVELVFAGPDARRMWQVIEGDVLTYSPAKPQQVILDLGKKHGGQEILTPDTGAYFSPSPLPDFQRRDRSLPVSRFASAWGLACRIGAFLTVVGFLGLMLGALGRYVAGVSETDVMRSTSGAAIVFTLSGMFVAGMIICLACGWRSSRETAALARRWKGEEPTPFRRFLDTIALVLVAALLFGIAMLLLGW